MCAPPLFLPISDEQRIQPADGIPAVLIQHAGLGPAVQLLDPADVMLGGGVVLTGDWSGLDAAQQPGQGPEHGLHQVKMDAVLVGLHGKIPLRIAPEGAWSGQPGLGLEVESGDGVPGGLVHPAGDRREELPLKEHDGLQGALPKDAVGGEPGQEVVKEGQLPQHGLQAADRLADQSDPLRHDPWVTPLSSAEPRVMGWPGV